MLHLLQSPQLSSPPSKLYHADAPHRRCPRRIHHRLSRYHRVSPVFFRSRMYNTLCATHASRRVTVRCASRAVLRPSVRTLVYLRVLFVALTNLKNNSTSSLQSTIKQCSPGFPPESAIHRALAPASPVATYIEGRGNGDVNLIS